MNSSLSEKEKDRLLLTNLKQLLTYFVILLSILVLIVLVSFFPVYIYTRIKPAEEIDLGSIYFYLSMIAGSSALFLFKNKSSDYSYWAKLLHTIILDNYSIAKYLFENEKRVVSKKGVKANNEFIVITGLARGGTTALTNLLFDARRFHSIRYSNMPFLMSPGIWKYIYNPKTKKVKERAHGDKVFFGENSIEAFEEYFFKVFLNDAYIEESSLNVHQITEPVYTSYLQYQQFFRDPQLNTLYLAKNNNFVLRYLTLRNYNQEFKVFMIFRSPVSHAGSLLRQHKNFTVLQSGDPFVKNYMNWLGHYEFGLNHKVFNFNQQKLWQDYKKDTVNYWIAIWINYYQYVLSLPKDDLLYFVDYEDLLNSPTKLKAKLGEILGFNISFEDQSKFEPAHLQDNASLVDDQLLKTAIAVYDELLKKKLITDLDHLTN